LLFVIGYWLSGVITLGIFNIFGLLIMLSFMEIRSFTQLESYKECRLLRKRIAILVKDFFPSEERFRLTDQIVRSSRRITACIAEGYGRFHHKENAQFCRMARGSIQETLEHLVTAYDETYISSEQLKSFKEQIDNCIKLLNGYIAYLSRQAKK